MFESLIVLFGTTNLVEVVLFYWPHYHLAGLIKLGMATAIVSSVGALMPITPAALAMPIARNWTGKSRE